MNRRALIGGALALPVVAATQKVADAAPKDPLTRRPLMWDELDRQLGLLWNHHGTTMEEMTELVLGYWTQEKLRFESHPELFAQQLIKSRYGVYRLRPSLWVPEMVFYPGIYSKNHPLFGNTGQPYKHEVDPWWAPWRVQAQESYPR